MSPFPPMQQEIAFHKDMVATGQEDYPQQALVIQGKQGFHPAGLPCPEWFVVVNPGGPDDAEQEDIDFNEMFEAQNNDVMLGVVSSCTSQELKDALWHQANEDFRDHVICDNGGAYVFWALPDGSFLVAGFDNGGSDIAQTGAMDAAARVGEIGMSAGESHYAPARATDPQNWLGIQRKVDVAILTQQILDLLPRNRLSP